MPLALLRKPSVQKWSLYISGHSASLAGPAMAWPPFLS